MKRLPWIAAGAVLLTAAVWAAMQMMTAHADAPNLMPDGALLSIEATNFRALLKDWNDSQEKRTWLAGDNYGAFSRSRLFQRLSQAQDEFSAAASIPTDESLLSSVAGDRSALALYDIGNLEFVYVTRMDQAHVEAMPLWQVRDKFEQRAEGAAQFFVHQDAQSNRTAAFAARDGWLVLGTRADLVAGVLDRIQGAQAHSLPDEPWYSDAVKQAAGPAGDLRMVLNLEKIVPSPYFRSYWVQENITEMKQYRAALCDLRRGKTYHEDRVLLRKAGLPATASGDVHPLIALAPEDAVFSSASASPDPERVLAELRENILDLKPAQAKQEWSAPAAATAENAGTAAMLEQRIDVAPVIVAQSDPYQPLRGLLAASQPTGLLAVYATRTARDEMFAGIDRAVVVESSPPWNEQAVKDAITTALRPGLTASSMGLEWVARSGASGNYSVLDGQVRLFLAVHDKQLLVSSSESLLQQMLARARPSPQASGVTYAAVFHHTPREQQAFRSIVQRLDSASGHQSASAGGDGDGQSPPFFSGNIASLSRMFAGVDRESIEEKDQGDKVTQSVVYEWRQP